eukprot:m.96248 g.96248  ORF g.96248 m.96248 type:complete len:160 (+) comp8965_c2_seq1:326-805(+)
MQSTPPTSITTSTTPSTSYKCKYCGASYGLKHNLTKHLRKGTIKCNELLRQQHRSHEETLESHFAEPISQMCQFCGKEYQQIFNHQYDKKSECFLLRAAQEALLPTSDAMHLRYLEGTLKMRCPFVCPYSTCQKVCTSAREVRFSSFPVTVSGVLILKL